MVTISTPPNGEADQAETSRDGLKRMQRLSEASRMRHNPYIAAFHPLTSMIIYPPSRSSGRHHVVSSIFADSPPRGLILPNSFSPAEIISISPDGAWITTFHTTGPTAQMALPGMPPGAGDLIVWDGGLLDPSTVVGNGILQASFPLSSPPLAILHVFGDRTRIAGGEKSAPAGGPAPPPGHSSSKSRGPTVVVLTADLIYFLHPHVLPSTVTLDTSSSAAVPGASVSAAGSGSAPLTWTINALRCPIGARAYADLANPGPLSGSCRAQRGWLGTVGGNDGVWAAVEKDGELRVIRIDIGSDQNSIPFLSTTPLPAMPRPSAPAFSEDGAAATAHLETVAFVPLHDDGRHGTANGAAKGEIVQDQIGVVMVYRDTDDSGVVPTTSRSRTRFELVGLHHRPATVVDGFKEIGSGDDANPPLDWFPSPKARMTAMTPEGSVLLALTPLPDVPAGTLALALLVSPTGLMLTHVNLVPPAEANTSSGRWNALVGEEKALDPSVLVGDAVLLPSQGVLRGELGLVALFGPGTVPRYVPSPRLGAEAHPTESLKHVAERGARSIVLAIRQGVDWSDVVRAAFGTVPRNEAHDLSRHLLGETLTLLVKSSRTYVYHLLRLQVAVWSLTDDPRRELSVEMLRMNEVIDLFKMAGEDKDGVISFDLDSVWHLVDVFEWGLGTLQRVFRDAVSEKAAAEWAPTEIRELGTSRLLFLVNPLLRRILARFVALLEALGKFITGLDKPIRPPESAFLLTRSTQATTVAQQRIADAIQREGVDLHAWGEVLAALAKTPHPSGADSTASMLALSLSPLAPLLPSLLALIPAPSSLFLAPEGGERDGATLAPIGDRPTARCDRCGARTVLKLKNQMQPPQPSAWTAWRHNWREGCMCGGTWMRYLLEAPVGLVRR